MSEESAAAARDLAAALAQARRNQKLTLAEVAGGTGLSKGTIGPWERGASFPSLLSLTAWAEVLSHRVAIVPLCRDAPDTHGEIERLRAELVRAVDAMSDVETALGLAGTDGLRSEIGGIVDAWHQGHGWIGTGVCPFCSTDGGAE